MVVRHANVTPTSLSEFFCLGFVSQIQRVVKETGVGAQISEGADINYC